MSTFQQFQARFTSHIRNPKAVARPDGVPARRMKVYSEIVFNNMNETLSTCFRVIKKMLSNRRWESMVRAFLAQHPCSTPLFRQIPEEFLHWLETSPQAIRNFPPYLTSLAHYEWVELAVAVSDARLECTLDHDGALLGNIPILAPAHALLQYEYPVHRLSPSFKPKQMLANPVHLLVFRNMADEVRFIELNPVSAQLLSLLQNGSLTGEQALQKIAVDLNHPNPQAIIQYGNELLEDLRLQEVIWGTVNAKI